MTPQTRRRFLTLAASAAATTAFRAQAPATLAATLVIDHDAPLHTLPADYIGLSFEAAQLANPAYFAASNHALIALFRQLSPSGVLRIGGGSSEFTTYTDAAPAAPPPFEVFGPDTSKTVKSGTVTTALALHNLRAFLDATHWTCLYGLNLGQGTKENAATEAAAAYRILGPRLTALQIGNEPDSFRNRYRPATYTPEDFVREWLDFHAAIIAKVPQAKFAGPDISNKLAYLTAFAAIAPQHPDVTLLSGHYYAMGPAGNPQATIDNLLSPAPLLTTMKWPAAATITDAMRAARLPYRMSEGNSCWNGGQSGVSDTFASALWCADTLLHFATLGWSGVNLHGGGNGLYSPIVGTPSTGFTRRPEFFGIQFVQHFAGATLLNSALTCDDARVTAYVFDRNGTRELALINKTAQPLACRLPAAAPRSNFCAEPTFQLSAPFLDSKSATFAPLTSHGYVTPAELPPYTARIFRLFAVPTKGGGRTPKP